MSVVSAPFRSRSWTIDQGAEALRQEDASDSRKNAEIEIVDATHVNLGFMGRTWPLRQALDKAAIPLLSMEERAEPLRVITDTDDAGNLQDDATMNFLANVFGQEVPSKVPCLVKIVDDFDETADSPVKQFLDALRQLPHLQFLQK